MLYAFGRAHGLSHTHHIHTPHTHMVDLELYQRKEPKEAN
jgi:hypothetical protein